MVVGTKRCFLVLFQGAEPSGLESTYKHVLEPVGLLQSGSSWDDFVWVGNIGVYRSNGLV